MGTAVELSKTVCRQHKSNLNVADGINALVESLRNEGSMLYYTYMYSYIVYIFF